MIIERTAERFDLLSTERKLRLKFTGQSGESASFETLKYIYGSQ